MYEVEITGGDRDPPPTFTHEGLNGVCSRMGAYLRQALDAQRSDGKPRAITIRLPAPRRDNGRDRRGRGTRQDWPTPGPGEEQTAAESGGRKQETHHGRPKLRY